MLPSDQISRQQVEQYRHDIRNHFDIAAMPRLERLKHYALHFAKYAGRIARDEDGSDFERTLVDTFLIGLSAANALKIKPEDLRVADAVREPKAQTLLKEYADIVGRFAEACEKSDHLEDFLEIARVAIVKIIELSITEASSRGIDLFDLAERKRRIIAANNFLVAEQK